ncbi:ATP-binding cassette domain-containing protein [Umezawaea sp. Da 62-37]|uniref:ABC transporter ATP-binding protein n=1 Tax=Umezawaea sp. Da 62-37 TaxID=3075927 RepID=UPI0028F734A9|nr:ATP-binding cassette domain-containing protein [Umezawaea sp. Da 62-37]WNV87678.1 ATP-binding cassette domain-containing protein [Umezawaea sp. Da 62-37]
MNTEAAIDVRGLSKSFVVPERDAGLRAALGNLLRRRTRTVHAVEDVDLTVARGEVVGFLGANGAGKTTVLKMLSGLLHPTSGEVTVLGHVPARRERAYLRRMTLVMGNRHQLQWDLPASDSYELHRAIYQVPEARFRRTREELVELLEIGELIRKPVRTLSLGERMKAELVGSLLHQPEVLFLDEPTLGLDVTMQKRIRSFVAEYSRRHGATVLLTSHYMADIQALCKRVVVVHHGRPLFDGDLSALGEEFAAHKEIEVTLDEANADLSGYGEVRSTDGGRVRLRVPRELAPTTIAKLLSEHNVLDLTVEAPPVEDVIEQVFSSGTSGAVSGVPR